MAIGGIGMIQRWTMHAPRRPAPLLGLPGISRPPGQSDRWNTAPFTHHAWCMTKHRPVWGSTPGARCVLCCTRRTRTSSLPALLEQGEIRTARAGRARKKTKSAYAETDGFEIYPSGSSRDEPKAPETLSIARPLCSRVSSTRRISRTVFDQHLRHE